MNKDIIAVKCPVCNGTQQVPIGFYEGNNYNLYQGNSTGNVMCRSCNGKGYLICEKK